MDGVLPPHEPDVEYVEGFLELFLLLSTLIVVEKIAEVGESDCFLLPLSVVKLGSFAIFYPQFLVDF